MIGIIGAMDSEVETLFANMSEKEKINVNNLTFYKGVLFGKEVVIVKCGIGKINAALCTQLLILNFKVEKVINTGIAGAVGEGLGIYDFVVSTEAVYHDFDTTFFGYKLGQVPGMPETFKADEKLAEAAVNAFNKSDLSKNHKIAKGLIASGDQFIAGGEKKKFIVSNFHPQCVEMEGCAIAHTCYANNVPFVILRCMSDCADDTVQVSYSEEEASKASSAFLMAVVKEL
ncbi:MAG: 5'-methylthioadenosine/adenosylhomocysteine nucleosidase [Treponema sp.]|nr:5'-methylthioadenosine/adenosylhomocysteine nucleosidase [Treponema sp.]